MANYKYVCIVRICVVMLRHGNKATYIKIIVQVEDILKLLMPARKVLIIMSLITISKAITVKKLNRLVMPSL